MLIGEGFLTAETGLVVGAEVAAMEQAAEVIARAQADEAVALLATAAAQAEADQAVAAWTPQPARTLRGLSQRACPQVSHDMRQAPLQF